MLTYKKLTSEETGKIYEQHMTVDFPPMELKPLKNILGLMERGFYSCYGFYEEEELRGYAFFCDNEDHTYSLLDYYAIIADYRGQGYGKEILSMLQKIFRDYEAIILEAENPRYAKNEEEYRVREGRLHFYEKCGAVFEEQESRVFGVDYVVLSFRCKQDQKDGGKAALSASVIRQKLIEIYRILVKEPHFTANVHIY